MRLHPRFRPVPGRQPVQHAAVLQAHRDPSMSLIVRDCTLADLPAILEIHNDAVLHTTSIWNYAPVDVENRAALLRDRRAKNYAFLVAEAEGEIAGYASFGDFRPHDGYYRTGEHSI